MELHTRSLNTEVMRRDALSPTLGPTFRALSDPKRRWYLQCLLDGEMRVLQFAEIFPIQLPSVLHHLRVLEKCGLVRSRKEGTVRLYSLRAERLEEADQWLRWLAARC